MLRIGCHLSAAKGFLHMGQEAVRIKANTFQFFTRNPRGSKAKALDLDDIDKFKKFCIANDIISPLAHAPYTLNPCSAGERVREFARMTMEDDLRRLAYLPETCYNFHPGSYTQLSPARGIELIAELLNKVMEPGMKTTLLLETMSGKGTEIGRSFAELAAIIERVHLKEHLGVCLDTCHVYDAGYDIKNDLDGVLAEFDEVIGLDRLKAIHLNDSKNPFASHKDRHEKIGEGSLGLETFERILNHPGLQGIPCYLETPNELPGYQEEIRLLTGLYKENK